MPKKQKAAPGNVLTLTRKAGIPDGELLASSMTSPEVEAASTLRQIHAGAHAGEDLEIMALIKVLEGHASAVNNGAMGRGEAMLASQAFTLNAVFHKLTRMAIQQSQLGHYDTMLRLALKAQSQCRSTWESISEIKNPRTATFVKQANIAAGHQQINNDSGAREIESPQTKLLETTRDEWLDTRATSQAVRGDQEVETVGAINGASH